MKTRGTGVWWPSTSTARRKTARKSSRKAWPHRHAVTPAPPRGGRSSSNTCDRLLSTWSAYAASIASAPVRRQRRWRLPLPKLRPRPRPLTLSALLCRPMPCRSRGRLRRRPTITDICKDFAYFTDLAALAMRRMRSARSRSVLVEGAMWPFSTLCSLFRITVFK